MVFATAVAAGLGAAGPALATELPAPPPVPEVAVAIPEPAAPSLLIPAIPIPELEIEPVVVTQVDAGNIDVSVRVLSPGEDGAATPEGATDVVSPATQPDITAAAEPADVASSEGATPAGGINTNVSIRVLSPGDRGDVTQIAGGSGEEVVEAGPDRVLPQADPAPASTAPPDDLSDAPQYQPEDFRYQSDSEGAQEPWNWVWVLSLDCAGNASSTSTDNGHQESLVWSWEWVWEWACSPTATNDSNAESGGRAPPPAEAGQPPEASSAVPSEAVAEPWVWTWTFTFCGETRTISTQGGTGTPLTWTWDWTWTWTCPNAATPDLQPPPAIDVSAPLVTSPPAGEGVDESTGETQRTLQLAGDDPTTTLATVWLPSVSLGLGPDNLERSLEPSIDHWARVEVVIATPMPTLELEVAIPPVVLPAATAPPLPSPAIPFPAVDVAAEPTTTAPVRQTVTRQPHPTPAPVHSPTEVASHASSSEPRVHHARPVEQTRARGARSKRDGQQLPLERRQSSQALGSSNAGGVVPSALLVGFAALTGFIVLAAPGLGRRIRVARALRPHSLDRPPIDHPG